MELNHGGFRQADDEGAVKHKLFHVDNLWRL